MRVALIYSLLAAIATATNIFSQDLVVRAYHGPYAILLSVLVGTGVGLIVKYVLDKRYIFSFTAQDIAHDGRVFLLYALMGLVTTAIFWGFEFGFHHLFESKEMRYLGGVIGLAIGYYAKYLLDRRFVFPQASTPC